MIILPEKFKESIVNRYNKDGIEWLNNIDKLIKKVINTKDKKFINSCGNRAKNIGIFTEEEFEKLKELVKGDE